MSWFVQEPLRLRRSVVVEVWVEPGAGRDQAGSSAGTAPTRLSGKRRLLQLIEDLREKDPDMEVLGADTMFPVFQLTASEETIDFLSRHPLVKSISSAPGFTLNRG